MARRPAVALLVGLLAVCAGEVARAQFATSVQAVEVYATVTRADELAVPDLVASDFEMLEDGVRADRVGVRGRGVPADGGPRRRPQPEHARGAAAAGDSGLAGVPARAASAGPVDGVGHRGRRRGDCAHGLAARITGGCRCGALSVEHHGPPRRGGGGPRSVGSGAGPSGRRALHRRCGQIQHRDGCGRARSGPAQPGAGLHRCGRQDAAAAAGRPGVGLGRALHPGPSHGGAGRRLDGGGERAASAIPDWVCSRAPAR